MVALSYRIIWIGQNNKLEDCSIFIQSNLKHKDVREVLQDSRRWPAWADARWWPSRCLPGRTSSFPFSVSPLSSTSTNRCLLSSSRPDHLSSFSARECPRFPGGSTSGSFGSCKSCFWCRCRPSIQRGEMVMWFKCWIIKYNIPCYCCFLLDRRARWPRGFLEQLSSLDLSLRKRLQCNKTSNIHKWYKIRLKLGKLTQIFLVFFIEIFRWEEERSVLKNTLATNSGHTRYE